MKLKVGFDGTDDAFGGGVPDRSDWAQYMRGQIIPVLNGLAISAGDDDRLVIDSIRSSLCATMGAGMEPAQQVRNLWSSYFEWNLAHLSSDRIRLTLEHTLYVAKQFFD